MLDWSIRSKSRSRTTADNETKHLRGHVAGLRSQRSLITLHGKPTRLRLLRRGRRLAQKARVVEWQTRTFEGRMPKGLRVQVPPRAFPAAFVRQLRDYGAPGYQRSEVSYRSDPDGTIAQYEW